MAGSSLEGHVLSQSSLMISPNPSIEPEVMAGADAFRRVLPVALLGIMI